MLELAVYGMAAAATLATLELALVLDYFKRRGEAKRMVSYAFGGVAVGLVLARSGLCEGAWVRASTLWFRC